MKFAKQTDDISNREKYTTNNRVYRNAMSPRKYRLNAYQVCINILKARHLPQNANSRVVVKVGKRRKKTVIRKKTDSPIFNEVKPKRRTSSFPKKLHRILPYLLNSLNYYLQYFVFDFLCDLDELLSTKIMIAVHVKTFLRYKFHGNATFEIALVWDQPGDAQNYSIFTMIKLPR